MRAFFPKYYAFLGLTSLAAAALAESGGLRVALFLCAALFFLALWLLTPRINAAPDAGHHQRFRALHGLSVTINLAQLIIFVGVLWTSR